MKEKVKIIIDKEEYKDLLGDLEVLKTHFQEQSIQYCWIENIITNLENNRIIIENDKPKDL